MKKSTNAVFGGVCAGIAEKFDIDPIWVRLIFLFCNLGVLYFALYLLMDEADESK